MKINIAITYQNVEAYFTLDHQHFETADTHSKSILKLKWQDIILLTHECRKILNQLWQQDISKEHLLLKIDFNATSKQKKKVIKIPLWKKKKKTVQKEKTIKKNSLSYNN